MVSQVDSLAWPGFIRKKRIMRRHLFFSLALLSLAFLQAELPPSAYEEMQSTAPEHLQIQVLRVDIEPGSSDTAQAIQVLATVEKVLRTSTGLKAGDLHTIDYTHEHRPPGWVGPAQVPILTQGDTHVAYLKPLDQPETYSPAAGAMSFHNF
jgi:hypothetical protein